MTPTLSIVIPVRDQAPRLRLTLAALERQAGIEPEDYEVIVVDDDSSDDPMAVVSAEQQRAPYAITMASCKSGGLRGLPRNVGAAAARGSLIIFLDGDALPGRRLLASHAASASPGRLVLGDIYVLPGTEHLLDPADGTPVRWAHPVDPLILPVQAVRDGIADASMMAHALKGCYPRQAAWQRQLEEVLVTGGVSFAWTGVIPHNLSMPREVFERLGGFDPTLPHSEGWDLGIRALRAGYSVGWAGEARSFHLYHARNEARAEANVAEARGILLAKYPDLPLDVIELWFVAAQGHPYVPAELGLGAWRDVERILADPERRAECRWLRREWARVRRPLSALDYRLHAALNRPRPPARTT